MPKYSGRSGGDENLVINLTVSGQEAAEREVKTFISTLNTMLKGAGKYNINDYFESTKASIDSVRDSLKTFIHDMGNAGNAGEFLKSYSSYIAQFEGSLTDAASHIKREFGDDIARQFRTTFDEVISSAEKAAPAIAQVFDPEKLRTAFSSFTYITKDLGADISKIFSAVRSGSTDELVAEIDKLKYALSDAEYQIATYKQRIEELGDSAANKKLDGFRETARAMSREFKGLLVANGVGSDDIGKFWNYIREIENGTTTVRDAFARARQELGHLFTTPLNSGGLEDALMRIENKIDEVVEKTRGVTVLSGNNGAEGDLLEHAERGAEAALKEAEALDAVTSRAAGISALTDALLAVAAGMKESGDAATGAFDAINRLVESMTRLGDIDEAKLAHVATIMSSLSGAAEVKAGTASTDNLIRLVSSINNIGDGKGIQTLRTLATLDFTRLSNLKVSGATLTHLAEDLPKIASVDLSPLQQLAAIDWKNLSELKIPKANLDNLTTLVDKTGIKLDASGFNDFQSAINNIGNSLDELKGKIADTFNLNNAISQAAELAKQYTDVKGALEKAATAGAKQNARAGSGKGGQGQGDSNTAYIQQLLKMQEQLNVWITKNESAYEQNKQTIDSFASAIQATITNLQSTIDGYSSAIQEAGVVTEDTIEGLRTSLSQITGDAAAQNAVEKEAQKAAAALQREEEAAWKVHDALEEADATKQRQIESAWDKEAESARQAAEAVEEATRKEKEAWYESEDAADRAAEANKRAVEAMIQRNIDAEMDAMQKAADAERELAEARERSIDAAYAKDEARAVAEMDRVAEATRKATDEYNRLEDAAVKAAAARAEYLEKQVDGLDVGAAKSGIKFSDDAEAMTRYKAAIEDARQAIEDLRSAHTQNRETALTSANDQVAAVKKLRDELNVAAETARSNAKALESLTTRSNNLANKIELFESKNGALPKGTLDMLKEYVTTLRDTGSISEQTFTEIEKGFANIQHQTAMANNGGKTFFQTMKEGWARFGGWSLVTRSFTKIISLFKQMVTAVKEVDSAMTELRKVTDLTAEGYNRFYQNATQMAARVGSSLADAINAVADFSRLGYDIDMAQELAEASLLYQNVADGLQDVSEATGSIISTIKAFGDETYSAMQIVDMFNEVGNNFAVSSAGIGEALQRSAAALATAGNSLEESIGMIVAANSVIQNPEVVGTSLKTLSMFYRSAKTEAEEAGIATDGMVESTAKLREELLALTGGKLDIQINDHEFKTTYQMLKDLSEIWDEVGERSEINQARILEMLGGKRNANVLASIITNFKDAEAAAKTAANSMGSAMAENQKYLDSIEGKTKLLRASFETMANALINSGIVKALIDMGRAVADMVTWLQKMGFLLPTIVTLAATIKTISQISAATKTATGIISVLSGTGDAAEKLNKVRVAFESLGGFAKQLAGTKVLSEIGGLAIDKELADGVGKIAKEMQNASVTGLTFESVIKKLKTGVADLGKGFKTFATSTLGKWTLGITAAITAITVVNNAIQSGIQNAINHGNEALKSTQDGIKNAKQTSKELKEISDEFQELSKGIDQHGNNVSLTDAQYERYLDLVKQIIDITPSLRNAYNEKGASLQTGYVDILKAANEEQQKLINGAKESVRINWKTILSGSKQEVKEAYGTGIFGAATGSNVRDALAEIYSSATQMGIEQGAESAEDILHRVLGDSLFKSLKDTFIDENNVYLRADDIYELYNSLTVLSEAYGAVGANTDMLAGAFGALGPFVKAYENELREVVDTMMLLAEVGNETGGIFEKIAGAGQTDNFYSGLFSVLSPDKDPTENYNALISYMEKYSDAIDEIEKARERMDSGETWGMVFDDFNEMFGEFPSIVRMFLDAFTGASQAEEENAENVVELKKSYEELAKSMDTVSKAMSFLRDVRSGEKNPFEMLKAAQEFVDTINGLNLEEQISVDQLFDGIDEDGNIQWSEEAVSQWTEAMVRATFQESKFAEQYPEVVDALATEAIAFKDAADATIGFSEAFDQAKNIAKIRQSIVDFLNGEGTDESKGEIISQLEAVIEKWNELGRVNEETWEDVSITDFLGEDLNDMETASEKILDFGRKILQYYAFDTLDDDQDNPLVNLLWNVMSAAEGATEKAYSLSDALKALNDVAKFKTEGIDLSDPISAIEKAKSLADEWNAARQKIGKDADKHWTDFIDPAGFYDGFDEAVEELRKGLEEFRDDVDETVEDISGDITAPVSTITLPVDARIIASGGMSDIGMSRDGKLDIEELAKSFIPDGYNGNVDLTSRKIIPIDILAKVGWKNFDGTPLDGDYATLFTNTFSAGNKAKGFDVEYDQDVICNITPILADGTPLSEDGLWDYIYEVVEESSASGKSIKEVDAEKLGLILSVDVVPDDMSLDEAYEMAGEWSVALHELQEEWDNIRFENDWFGDETVDAFGVFGEMFENAVDAVDSGTEQLNDSLREAHSIIGQILDPGSIIASAGMSDVGNMIKGFYSGIAKAAESGAKSVSGVSDEMAVSLENILDAWDKYTADADMDADPFGIVSSIDAMMQATRSANTSTETIREMYSDIVEAFIESDEKLSALSEGGKSRWKSIIMGAIDAMIDSQDFAKKSKEIADAFNNIGDAYTFMQEHVVGERVGNNFLNLYTDLEKLRTITGDKNLDFTDFVKWDEELGDFVYDFGDKTDILESKIDEFAADFVSKFGLTGDAAKTAIETIKASFGEEIVEFDRLNNAISQIKSVRSFEDTIASFNAGDTSFIDAFSQAVSLADELGLKLEDVWDFSSMQPSIDAAQIAVDAMVDKLADGAGYSDELRQQLKDAARAAQETASNISKMVERHDSIMGVVGSSNYGNGVELTYDAYKSLMAVSSDYASTIEYMNGRLTVNSQKFHEVSQAIAQETIEMARNQIQMNQLKIEELVQKYETLTDAKEKLEVANQIQQLQNESASFAILASEIENATNAFARFNSASDTTEGDMYSSAKKAAEIIRGVLSDPKSSWYGQIGNEKYALAVDLLINPDIDFEESRKQIERYFGDENGLWNFADDLRERFADANGEVTASIADMAAAFGISEDAVKALLQQLNLYNEEGDKFTFDGDGEASENAQTLEEKIAAIKKETEEAQTTINTLNETEVKPKTEGAQTEAQSLAKEYQGIASNIAEMSSNGFQLDTSAAQESASRFNTTLTAILNTLTKIASMKINVPFAINGSAGAGGGTGKSWWDGFKDRIKGLFGMSNATGTGVRGFKGGKSLVGELGREIVVDMNRGEWYTVGDNGPEIVNIPKNSLILNNEETERILAKQNSKARKGGRSNSTGTGVSNGPLDWFYQFFGGGKVPQKPQGPGKKGGGDSGKNLKKQLEALLEAFEKVEKEYDHLIEHLDQDIYKHERGQDFDALAKDYTKQAEYYQKIYEEAMKKIQEMKKLGAKDSDEDLQALEKKAWEAYRAMQEAFDKMNNLKVDALSNNINELSSAYSTLMKAADEYNNNGSISLATFQAILENGIQYLQFLKKVNGQYVLDTAALQKYIAEQQKQLAIEKALAVIRQLKNAIDNKDLDLISKLITGLSDASDATWDYVFAQLALLKAQLTPEQYQLLVEYIKRLKELSEHTDPDPESEDSASKYERLADAIDNVRSAYDLLDKAVDEYNSTGTLSLDTFKQLLELGPGILSVLQKEHGVYTLNRKALEEYLKAQKKQLAIQKALSTISALQKALAENDAAAIAAILGGLDDIGKDTWGAVERALKKLKEQLSPEQYAALEAWIKQLKELAEESGTGDNEPADKYNDLKASLEAAAGAYETLKKAVEEYNTTGEISLDTFKQLLDLGPGMLSILYKENGIYKINREALEKYMQAQKKQLAIQKALTTLSALEKALAENDAAAIAAIMQGLDDIGTETWGAVERALKKLKEQLSPEQYEALRKWIEQLKKLTKETGTGNSKDAERYNDVKSAIEGVVDAYSILKNAVKEYNETGRISIDTFKQLLDLGPGMLSVLQKEGGMYKVNIDALEKYMQAQKKQLAIQRALTTISELQKALAENDKEAIAQIMGGLDSIGTSTWGAVERALKKLKKQLDPEQYKMLKQWIAQLKQLSQDTGGFKDQEDPVKDLGEAYEKLNNQIEHYIAHQQQAFKMAQFGEDYSGMEHALRQQIQYYGQIVSEAKKAIQRMQYAGATDSNEDLQKTEQSMWSAVEQLRQAQEQLATLRTDALTAEVDKVQNAYRYLTEAVTQYNETGHITVDTFQDIIGNGIQYLGLLRNENGEYEISEDKVRSLLRARKDQLAAETAMSYVTQIRQALQNGEIEKIKMLVDASQSLTSTSWGLVYANLALAKSEGLSEQTYQKALTNIQNLQALAEMTEDEISEVGEETVEDRVSNMRKLFEELSEEIDHYIKHLEQSYRESERAFDYDGMSKILTREAEYYAQKVSEARKTIDAMISEGADDTNEDLQSVEEAMWSASNSMYDAFDKLRSIRVDALTKEIGNLQTAFGNLKQASDEFNETGKIDLDTFESLVSGGVQYLSLLEEQNGQYVISTARIEDYLAARKEQLAMETAMSYVSELREAMQNNETQRLKMLTDATNSLSVTTWDLVYAQLAALKASGMNDAMYQQAVANIDRLRAIARATNTDMTAAQEDVSSGYKDQEEALDSILEYTKDLIRAEADQRKQAIQDQIEAYQEIVNLKKEAINKTKEEVDYQEDIAEKVMEIAKLQAKADLMSLDSSRAASAQRQELLQQIHDKQKELSETQNDYALNLQTEALDKEAEEYAASMQEEIKAIEASVSSEEKVYQLALERIRDQWDTLYADLINWNTEQGNVINDTITEAWNSATEAVRRYGSYLEAINQLHNAQGESGADSNYVVANIPKYHTGGVVGKAGELNGEEVLAVLKKGELVMNEESQAGLYTVIDFVKTLGERLGTKIGRLKEFVSPDRFTPAFADAAAPNAGIINTTNNTSFSPQFNVQISGDVSDRNSAIAFGKSLAQSAADTLLEAFSHRGINILQPLRQ